MVINNISNNILTKELKQLYTNSIDMLLAKDGLTVPCVIKYHGLDGNSSNCNNCVFDPISQLSANLYNDTGPSPFPEGGVCPICLGQGFIKQTAGSSETVYLAVIFDSKYWLNWSSKTLNIPDNMIQIICGIELLSKLRAASELLVDTALSPYGHYSYERAGDPEPAGLGDHKYIISMWKRK